MTYRQQTTSSVTASEAVRQRGKSFRRGTVGGCLQSSYSVMGQSSFTLSLFASLIFISISGYYRWDIITDQSEQFRFFDQFFFYIFGESESEKLLSKISFVIMWPIMWTLANKSTYQYHNVLLLSCESYIKNVFVWLKWKNVQSQKICFFQNITG